MGKKKLQFEALLAEQGLDRRIAMIRATAAQVRQIATIERLGRDDHGKATGFQRPQVAGHIAEIRDYLERGDAVLPNAIVLAFVEGARLVSSAGRNIFEVDISNGAPGLVVDGQQRLSALTLTGREDFELFVSCMLCRDVDDLRRQFILINNTKPLPKSLIYELLPTVDQLPERLNSRQLAAQLTDSLNFKASSSLHRQIKMQTNPKGVLKDTALQRAIMNSEAAGALQVLMSSRDGLASAAGLFSNFYQALQEVFEEDWTGHKPTTSRLVHAAGIVAMGYVMDEIYSREHDGSVKTFVAGLQPLVGRTAWSDGHWRFSKSDSIAWDRLEYTPRQVMQLTTHLISMIREKSKTRGRQSKARTT